MKKHFLTAVLLIVTTPAFASSQMRLQEFGVPEKSLVITENAGMESIKVCGENGDPSSCRALGSQAEYSHADIEARINSLQEKLYSYEHGQLAQDNKHALEAGAAAGTAYLFVCLGAPVCFAVGAAIAGGGTKLGLMAAHHSNLSDYHANEKELDLAKMADFNDNENGTIYTGFADKVNLLDRALQ